ncbi:MAG TPA: hypothetical protein VEB19_12040 [Gemmatimonadaceae bacterium]|nr:hypothetical protein [Gemmatimonadaceae bacterium]
MMRGLKVFAIATLAFVCSAHIGSPDVFFRGKAGSYDVSVVVRPPEVVPGIARVTVRAGADVQRVSIRPVFWRAGSKGAPSADETRRLQGSAGTFEGSLWLMARGAYSVDVIVDGAHGPGNVLVPVASVATGRLGMNGGLAALLIVLGGLLFAGLVNIVYKAAGESLLPASEVLDRIRRRRAQRVAAIAMPILALGLFGGARWWKAVDSAYERTMYSPSRLALSWSGDELQLSITDTLFQPPRRPSALIRDHGKLMHLFLIRAGDAGAFAHLHPRPLDTTAVPDLAVRIPRLPAGAYHVFGDVVHETGFERTTVGSLTLTSRDSSRPSALTDPDDAWHVGEPATGNRVTLGDGSIMEMTMDGSGPVRARVEQSIRVVLRNAAGDSLSLDPYLGMPAHGVVARLDGRVYVHLHPMGTVTLAAQQAFIARDRGDTTQAGRLNPDEHANHTSASPDETSAHSVEFPYAFPTSGEYRLFIQVKRGGRILTGAFAIPVMNGAAEGK